MRDSIARAKKRRKGYKISITDAAKAGLGVLIILSMISSTAGCSMLGTNANASETTIVMNEIVSSSSHQISDTSTDSSDWIELYNCTDSDINLAGYRLTDNPKNTRKYTFPDATIEKGGYLVIYAGSQGNNPESKNLYTGFKLSNNGETLYLIDSQSKIVSQAEVPALNTDQSYARLEDGTYGLCAVPTPGCKNDSSMIIKPVGNENVGSLLSYGKMDSDDPVRINEVMPKNSTGLTDSDGDRFAWAELYNNSDQPVSLKRYYLSDNANDLYKWAFPETIIPANGYLIIYLSGKKSDITGLHASFRLSNGEKALYLANYDAMRVDEMPLPIAADQEISVSRNENGLLQYHARPTPGKANAKGYSDPAMIGYFDTEGVYICEVCAANAAKSNVNDWVELYNGSNDTIDLSGYSLSNDADMPAKWKIPSLKIEPKTHAVIEATSNKTRQNANTATFGIAPSGETLLLSDAEGNSIDRFETGMLRVGVTSGRIEGDSSIERVYFNTPTRGNTNDKQVLKGYTATPGFSETGLYHNSAFQLGITCTTPGAKVYYTVDGSIPTQSSNPYTEPIPVSTNTPVRAIAFTEGLLPSEISTATYLFDNPHTVPVFCINGDPAEIKKILSDTNRDHKPEYSAHVAYFEADGSLGVSFSSGLRIKGRSSMQNPQKSLVIRLRSAYGPSSVTYPFFPACKITTYYSLALRNAGQDNAASRIHDAYFSKVFKGMNVDSTETKTVIAYINGEYYGVFDLNEEQNADYFTDHYGVDSNDVEMIERNDTVMYGANDEFLKVRQYARTWNTKDDAVFAEFAKLVDVDACTDYLIAQTYFGNGDVINQRFWRTKDYSIKWRPVLYDLDWCMRQNTSDRNVFHRYIKAGGSIAGNGAITYMDIFYALSKNQAWRDRFVERFVQLSVTQFDTKRILGIFDNMVATMQPEMGSHIAKFHTPRSMETWHNELGKLRNALEKRQAIVLGQLKRFFHVSDATIQGYIDKYSSTVPTN